MCLLGLKPKGQSPGPQTQPGGMARVASFSTWVLGLLGVPVFMSVPICPLPNRATLEQGGLGLTRASDSNVVRRSASAC